MSANTPATVATEEVARARAAQIRAGIQNYLHTLANISQAYAQRDWTALGYQSWEAYVDGEFGAERLKLSPEHRQKAVQELRLGGMSQRAIASTVGVDVATVNRDLRGVASATPAVIQGADGKTYAATRPTPEPSREADARPDAPQAEGTAVCEATTDAGAESVRAGDSSPAVAEGEPAAGDRTAVEVEVPPSADEADDVRGGAGGDPLRTGQQAADVHAAPAPPVASVSSPDATGGVTPREQIAAALTNLRDLLAGLPVTAASDRAFDLLAALAAEVRTAIEATEDQR